MNYFDYEDLLQQYRLLWNHRLIETNESSEIVLKETIKRELSDANSHPRVRRSIYEKFYIAVKRLEQSSISSEKKLQLISLYIKLMEQFNAESKNE